MYVYQYAQMLGVSLSDHLHLNFCLSLFSCCSLNFGRYEVVLYIVCPMIALECQH